MKIAKKIVFVAVALLPLLATIAGIVSTVGNDTRAPYVPMGTLTFIPAVDGVEWSTETDTWADRILTPMIGTRPLTGFYGSIARLALYLQDNAGISVSFPLFGSMLYLAYLAWIAIADMLVDFITFVPRKCAEIFR